MSRAEELQETVRKVQLRVEAMRIDCGMNEDCHYDLSESHQLSLLSQAFENERRRYSKSATTNSSFQYENHW